MKLISHRGNIDEKNIDRENSFSYIIEAIEKGYDVEVDIWYTDGCWYLGHNKPTYKIDFENFNNYIEKIWFHCKNLEALQEFNKSNSIYFWHENDSFTLTSNKYIWTFPGKKLTNKSICVLPEISDYSKDELTMCYGICSDYIKNFSN